MILHGKLVRPCWGFCPGSCKVFAPKKDLEPKTLKISPPLLNHVLSRLIEKESENYNQEFMLSKNLNQ